jgi:ATP-dependent Lon protease
MRDFRDAKAMAQTLREALKAKSVSLTHSESLELIARLLGFREWNVLSARIQTGHSAPEPVIVERAGLPTVPLRDLVLFPNMIAPLLMGRERSKRAVERAIAGDQRILAVTQRRAADDNPSQQGLYRIGVTASVIDQTALDDGTIRLMVKGLERAAVVGVAEGPFLTAEVAPVEEARGQDAQAFDLSRAVLEEFQAYRNASLSAAPYARLPHIREPGPLADAVAPFLLVEIDRRQDLLETADVVARLEKILALMEADRQAA